MVTDAEVHITLIVSQCLSIFAPSSLILLPQSYSPFVCLLHFTPLPELLTILSPMYVSPHAPLLSPAVPRPSVLHSIHSLLLLFYFLLLYHFISWPTLLLTLLLSLLSSTFYPWLLSPSQFCHCSSFHLVPLFFWTPILPFVSSPSLLLSALWTQTWFFFLYFIISFFFNSHPFIPCIDEPALSPSFSTPTSQSMLFSMCLCGLQAYLPPRRQAAFGEIWKPALSCLSDLPRWASCLTSKGNE